MMSQNLPARCKINKATAKEIWSIRKMVLGAKLDPTQLRPQQFWTMECEGKLVACGQLRDFSNAQELGSLVVLPAWRGRSLGTHLAQHLIAQATKPLYLECLGNGLAKFYTRLGFVAVSWQDLPKPLKFKFGISQLAKTVLRVPVTLMQYRGETPSVHPSGN